MITLRPYQEKFISDIREAYRRGAKSVLGVAPTGSGKTVCFSYMAQSAASRKLRVGILAHRIELLDQISATLVKFDVPHAFIAPGRQANPFEYVQVCSVRSVASKIERYVKNPFDLLIVDEAHHAAGGSSWHQVISAHKGKHVLGVTATPQRLSGEPLADAFDEMVQGPSVETLMEIGALSKYRAFAPVTPDMNGVPRRMGDFARAENEATMDKPTITGDAVLTYLKLAKGKRAIVFCVSISHAEHVAAQFSANDIPAASLDGKMGKLDRKNTLADFEAGRVLVLTSCEIVSEGFDLPAIEAAILLRPTQSLALHLQQVGRALRTWPGKEKALILDHAGNLARHGLPDDPREWSLKGAEKRAGGIGGSLPTVTCDGCFAVFRPLLACPYCGLEREIEGRKIEEVEGELGELDLEAIKRSQKTEVAQARDLPALMAIARARGYNPRWAQHIMEARSKR